MSFSLIRIFVEGISFLFVFRQNSNRKSLRLSSMLCFQFHVFVRLPPFRVCASILSTRAVNVLQRF